MPTFGKKDRIQKFQEYATALFDQIVDHLPRIQLYCGPSFEMNNPEKEGMLIFSFKKQLEDGANTFLFFSDALRVEEVDAETR